MEEEAATFPRTFSSLENHITVELWTETFVQHLKASEVVLESLHEGVHSVVSHLNVRVNYEGLIVLLVMVLTTFL